MSKKQVEQKQVEQVSNEFTFTVIVKSPTDIVIGQPIAMGNGRVTMAMLRDALRIGYEFLLRQEGYQIARMEQAQVQGDTQGG